MLTTISMIGLVVRYVTDARTVFDDFIAVRGCHPEAARQNRALDSVHTIQLPTLGHCEYRYHGRGCEFRCEHVKIDIDFLYRSTDVGFDSWRLWRYARENRIDEGADDSDLHQRLQSLALAGIIIREDVPHSSMYQIPPLSPLYAASRLRLAH